MSNKLFTFAIAMRKIILITGGQRSGKSVEAERLALSLSEQHATFIFVTNEIGSGGVSENAIQRKFTDLEGWMNQYVASKADKVILMVSGIAVTIK